MDLADSVVERLQRNERIDEQEIGALCAVGREVLAREPNVVHVDTPVVLCGNLVGQFHDLMRIFAMHGWCPGTKYLFLGAYVNRGEYSLETFLLLLALKVRHPDRITLLRGNHDSASVSRVFGLYDQCKRLYSVRLWRDVCSVFNLLSLSAVIDGQTVGVHAGPPMSTDSLDMVRLLERNQDVPDAGIIAEMLWACPEPDSNGFWSDSGRTLTFGAAALAHFLHTNGLANMVRSHEVVQQGFMFSFEQKLLTIFSASDYCREFDNFGSTVVLDGRCVRPTRHKLSADAPEFARFRM